jgi:putative ABC transport system substrate-binding protein
MGASVTWLFAELAQEAGRTYRLGIVYPPPRDNPANMFVFNELRRHGFIEGQNLMVEYRAYAQHIDLVPQYAAELVKAQVDVIATAGEEQYAPFSRRRKPFRSLPLWAICWGPD